MGGIVALVDRSGQGVDSVAVDSMVEALSHRGPDGSDQWVDGPCGLGHLHHYTTPTAGRPDQPLRRDDCVVVADGRVDNRRELEELLDLDAGVTTDAEYLLAAYRKWGTACPEHVVGAYAFAIWDESRRRLFCARDHAGIRPCYVATGDGRVAVASEIRALRRLPFVSTALDEIAVGDFLVGDPADTERTFFEDVTRLPPGHALVATDDEVRTWQYWSLDPTVEISMESDEAYAAAFKQLFERAVQCRLRRPPEGRVGSTLSGGLDSSAIATVAQRFTPAETGPFPTVSLSFEGIPGVDETAYAESVLETGDFDGRFVAAADLHPFRDVDRVLTAQETPFFANSLFLHWGMYGTAADMDVRVMLDGYGGDETLGRGVAYLAGLARSGQLRRLAAEIPATADRRGESVRTVLLNEVVAPLVPEPLWRARRLVRGESDPLADRTSVLNTDFTDRIGIRKRLQRREEPPPKTVRDDHRWLVTQGLLSRDLVAANKAGIAFGIEPRFPFLDRRLVEFCLALPADQKFRRGWERFVLRRALGEYLPSDVRWREDKADLRPCFLEGLRTHDAERLRSLAGEEEEVETWRYVDRAAFGTNVDAFLDGRDLNARRAVWRPALLGSWLRRRRNT
ncbi:asparagine synthase (glutamine-hydrolyzing) [Halorientalis halophila]|uniref:asparagine synthase (glutamine-hydrolyzing) n=1 Tax=Halorientalis halophila TaxID=3108499 RepID=UPI003009694D